MEDATIKGTLKTIEDLIGAADVVESTGEQPDVVLRYRYEAAALLSDLGHGLLARADRVRSSAQAKYSVALSHRTPECQDVIPQGFTADTYAELFE